MILKSCQSNTNNPYLKAQGIEIFLNLTTHFIWQIKDKEESFPERFLALPLSSHSYGFSAHFITGPKSIGPNFITFCHPSQFKGIAIGPKIEIADLSHNTDRHQLRNQTP